MIIKQPSWGGGGGAPLKKTASLQGKTLHLQTAGWVSGWVGGGGAADLGGAAELHQEVQL